MAVRLLLPAGKRRGRVAAELDTPDKRRRYVAGMYGHAVLGRTRRASTRRRSTSWWSRSRDEAAFRALDRDLRVGARQAGKCRRRHSGSAHVSHTDPGAVRPGGPRDPARLFPDQAEVVFAEHVGPFVVAGRRALPPVGARRCTEPGNHVLLSRPSGKLAWKWLRTAAGRMRLKWQQGRWRRSSPPPSLPRRRSGSRQSATPPTAASRSRRRPTGSSPKRPARPNGARRAATAEPKRFATPRGARRRLCAPRPSRRPPSCARRPRRPRSPSCVDRARRSPSAIGRATQREARRRRDRGAQRSRPRRRQKRPRA